MLRDKLQSIVSQPKQAIIWVVFLSIVPFLHLLGLLLVLVVTLRNGWRQGILLALIAAGLNGIMSHFVLHVGIAQMLLQMLNPCFLWMLACLLRKTRSWQKVIEATSLIGFIVVLGIQYFYPNLALAWSQALSANLQQIVHIRPAIVHSIDPADWQQLLVLFGALAPGLRTMLLLMSALISLVMARYLQAVLYNPGGLKQELYYVHFNYQMGGGITSLLIITYLIHTSIWLSLLPIVMIPLLSSGLSLLHYMTARYKYQVIILLIFYASVLTLLPQLLFLVILLGYIDCFINFRNHFALQKR